METKLGIGDKRYRTLVLLNEKRTCVQCNAVLCVSAGAFLEEETLTTKHLIRRDKLTPELVAISKRVKTEIREIESEVQGCHLCVPAVSEQQGATFILRADDSYSDPNKEEKTEFIEVMKLSDF